MAFLIAMGFLGSDRLGSVLERPVIFIVILIAGLLPVGLSHGLVSAIVTATVAVVFYAVVIWLVLTVWDRLRSR
jgi:hypothetical protein